jgi:hypothetical protein
MATPSSPPILFAPPSDAEAAALAVVVGYLTRAGTQAASRLLVTRIDPNERALISGLRDQMLAGAALCDGLLDLTGDQSGTG